ncbi:MAG: 16S rRNA (guanine(527)-N(7))-methyltransferase RsmG [Erysipelothrix sp.]|nr:16S rRNA (guanine(527)-N(7))-methyltransferase RsmG [Erysipelothrix sp.]
MKKEVFYETLESLGLPVDSLMMERFETYKKHIQKVNQVLNLTAIDDDEGIYLKHFYDSLLINSKLESGMHLCDVGSGAGFPGMVIAIARQDIEVVLIEPTTKRTKFLEEVAELCNLENVTVVNKRAEEAIEEYRAFFDVVTARAVAYLDILSELCIPFVKVGGTFIAMKGSKGMEELEVSKKALKILGAEVSSVDEMYHESLGERININIIKISKTPSKYPRNYGRIKKTPLSGRKND